MDFLLFELSKNLLHRLFLQTVSSFIENWQGGASHFRDKAWIAEKYPPNTRLVAFITGFFQQEKLMNTSVKKHSVTRMKALHYMTQGESCVSWCSSCGLSCLPLDMYLQLATCKESSVFTLWMQIPPHFVSLFLCAYLRSFVPWDSVRPLTLHGHIEMESGGHSSCSQPAPAPCLSRWLLSVLSRCFLSRSHGSFRCSSCQRWPHHTSTWLSALTHAFNIHLSKRD